MTAVRNSGAIIRRKSAVVLTVATLCGGIAPALTAEPAQAATRSAAVLDPVLTLELLGLDVVERDWLIGAAGPAAAVRTAADLFAATGDYALFTGPNETGTGYLAITFDNPTEWAELQVPTATIGSIINNTTDDLGFYPVTAGEGHLADEVGPHTTENAPAAEARMFSGGADANGLALNSPGVVSGNLVQVPVEVPVNVCGNIINVVGLLNPAAGNTCVNK